ncbi:hypothetical protein J3Q64DRAFT_1776743, partial [Phycomyces blakesleeanus]
MKASVPKRARFIVGISAIYEILHSFLSLYYRCTAIYSFFTSFLFLLYKTALLDPTQSWIIMAGNAGGLTGLREYGRKLWKLMKRRN